MLKKIYTRLEVDEVLSELNLLKVSLSKTDNSFDEALKNKVRLDLADTPKDVDQISQLIKQIESLKVVELALAIKPTQNFIEKILTFVETNFGPDIVLDLKFNPDLIAGAQVIYGGKYFDFSLKKSLEDYFKNLQGVTLKVE